MAARERTNDSDRSRASDDSSILDRPPIYEYSPVSVLEVPKGGDHDQYEYRWVTEHVNGEPVPQMIQRRLHEKYVRVTHDQLPEDFILDESKGDGVARRGGLILMRAPKAYIQARTNYFQKLSQSRVDGVNHLQGVAGKDAIEQDRGSRSISGDEARQMLQSFQSS